METLSYNTLISLASEIAIIEKEERAKLPYTANIIDDDGIRINENAHSRILRILLNYAGHDYNYPIYHKFIDLLKDKCKLIKNVVIHIPNITTEKERIDILIDESPSYSIIIENKVCGAPDGQKQIERYIKKVQAHNVANDNIFVVYLTRYGYKKITDISLTAKAKKYLDYDDPKLCRFIELNYRYDLLPMFENVLEQIDLNKEPLLYSSLVQYIDFWKGKFNMRDGEQTINQKTSKHMTDKLNINSVQDCLKISTELESLQERVETKKDELMEHTLNENVIFPLKKKWGNKYTFEYKKLSDKIHISMTPPCWRYCCILIGIDENGVFIGVYGERITSVVAKNLKCYGYEKDEAGEDGFNEGCFKYLEEENLFTSEFWDIVDNGEIFKDLNKYIKEIITALDGKRL